MNKNKGFTLIELIIVIVILGILAVTAAPKFLDLQGDANSSTIQGVDGAINSAMNVVYGKAVIAGVASITANTGVGIDMNGNGNATDTGVDILTSFGYPTANANGLLVALDLDTTTDFDGAEVSPYYVISAKGSTAPSAADVVATNGDEDGCYVAYQPATGTTVPAKTIVNVDAC
ncbi:MULTISPECIES: prepilin-type N-terminal cleavage/methylation domain-containing protein [unclassified Pseudoalteromonas]|uniref:prepilin-type N-terminal cleavage/methylation domain-containing protein n=1 Tax=unclassified Pseudoalteromonas TaxID=194690 RepID=UPI0005A68D61|nr:MULTISPECIES: prepilin-type N-terminal cleavage/methylation domain-containing protein [unclassified Pseudoalteromonas]